MATEYELSFTASEIDEKLRKVDSLSSGGASSWNDLPDRPFGEEGMRIFIEHSKVDTNIAFPVTEIGLTLVRLTDKTFSREELLDATFTLTTSDNEIISDVISETNILEEYDGGLLLVTFDDVPLWVCYKTGEHTITVLGEGPLTVNVPEVGCYTVYFVINQFVSSEISKSTVKQLDNKYLAILDHVGENKEILEEQTITSLNNVQGDIKLAYLPVFDIVEGETYQIHWLDRVFTCEAIQTTFGDNEGLGLGNFSIMADGVDTGEPFLIGVEINKAFAAMYTTETTLPITFRIYQTETYTIKNKYLSILESHKNTNDLLSSTTRTSQFFDTYQMYGISVDTTAEMLNFWHQTNKKDVLVEFDGETYSCTPQYVEAVDGMMIGNCSAFGGTGNNEPFVISITANGTERSLWLIGALADSFATEHTVRIYQMTDEDVYNIKNEHLSILDCIKGASEFEYLPQTTFTYDPSSGDTVDEIYSNKETYDKFMANTAPITVLFDDIPYVCEVQHDPQGFSYIGNASGLIGGIGNNEPFLITCIYSLNGDTHNYEYAWVVIVLQDSVVTEHTIKIYQDATPDNYVLKNEHLSILNYTEASETDILAEQDVEFTYASEIGGAFAQVLTTLTALVENEIYVVVLDGTEYVCTAYKPDVEGFTDVVIGNVAIQGLSPDTGEPFMAGIVPYDTSYCLQILVNDTADTTHKIRIYQKADDKYTIKNEHLSILNHIESSETDIIAEQDIEFVYDSGASMGYVVPVSAASVVEGNVYIVIFDEVKYRCIAFTHPDGASGTFIGNAAYVAASSDTGEPFIATISSGEANETGENMLAMMTLDTADTTHKVRIYQETPEKYMLKEEHLPSEAIKTLIDEYIGEVLRGEY